MARSKIALAIVVSGLLTLPATTLTPPAHATNHRPLTSASPAPPQPRVVPMTGDVHRSGDAARAARRVAAHHFWHQRRVSYYPAVPRVYQWGVQRGVAMWNATGLGLTFVKASSAATADIPIRLAKSMPTGVLGITNIRSKTTYVHTSHGWVGHTTYDISIVLHPHIMETNHWFTSPDSPLINDMILAHTVAHELGHAIGLEHTSVAGGCGLMSPSITIGGCPLFSPTQPGYGACQLVDRSGLPQAVQTYGGTTSYGRRGYCPRSALPSVALSAAVDPSAGATITWPASGGAGTVQAYLVDSDAGSTCPRPVASVGGYHAGDVPVRYRGPDFGHPWDAAASAPLSAGSVHVDALWNDHHHCILARAANATAGSRAPLVSTLVLQVPQPAAPVVDSAEAFYSPGQQTTTVRLGSFAWSPDNGFGEALEYAVGPTCPAWDPTTFQVLDPPAQVPADVDVPAGPGDCISLVTYDRGRSSQVTHVVLPADSAPSAPSVSNVRRRAGLAYDPTAPTWMEYSFDRSGDTTPTLLALPGDPCPPTTWPSDTALPDDHIASYDGQYVQGWTAYGDPATCVTFYAISAGGLIGPGVQVPIAPAPSPTTPALSNVRIGTDPYGSRGVLFNATFDSAHGDLWGIVDTTCHTSWPVDQGYGGVEPTSPYVLWTELAHPCLSVFAVNDDGTFSAAATAQL